MGTGANIRILRNLVGLTLEQLSEMSGVDVGTISALENRDSSRSKYFPAIAQAFGITTDELASEISPQQLTMAHALRYQMRDDDPTNWPTARETINMVFDQPGVERRGKSPVTDDTESNTKVPHEDDYAIVPQFHVNGSCGDGYMNDHVEIRGGLAFKRDWLARMKIDPERASVIYARGDSMSPTLNDGEVLLIDNSQTEPMSSKVYVINVDGDLRVKRIFKRPGGWVIVSDNPDKIRYPDEPLSAITDIRILGRVVWRGGGL